jgi:hypothetical protein
VPCPTPGILEGVNRDTVADGTRSAMSEDAQSALVDTLGWNIGLGKGEVDSSILSSSTIYSRSTPKTILLNQIVPHAQARAGVGTVTPSRGSAL